MATFLANEINTAERERERDITGLTVHDQFMFPLMGYSCRVFEDIVLGRRSISNQRK